MILPYNKIQFCTPPKCEEETEERHTITIGTNLVHGEPTFYYRLNGNWFRQLGKHYIIDQGNIVYDKGTNCYIAFTSNQFMYKRHFISCYRAFENYRVTHFYENKISFIVISRNACSCIRATAAKQIYPDETRNFYAEPTEAWDIIDDPLKVITNNTIPDDHKCVFVYQHPFSRWCNTCNFFEGIAFNFNGTYYLPQYLNKEKFQQKKLPRLYSFLAHCKAEKPFTNTYKDQHLMSQLETIGLCPREPDLVVPLPLLSTYIRKEIGMEPIKANAETNWWFDPKTDVPQDIQEEVKNLYNEDYDIPELFKGKFYEG